MRNMIYPFLNNGEIVNFSIKKMRLNLKINLNHSVWHFHFLNIFFQHLFYYLYFEKKIKYYESIEIHLVAAASILNSFSWFKGGHTVILICTSPGTIYAAIVTCLLLVTIYAFRFILVVVQNSTVYHLVFLLWEGKKYNEKWKGKRIWEILEVTCILIC